MLMAFLLKLGRFDEIWPIFISKYIYRSTFELCGLEIGHLAAVHSSSDNHSSLNHSQHIVGAYLYFILLYSIFSCRFVLNPFLFAMSLPANQTKEPDTEYYISHSIGSRFLCWIKRMEGAWRTNRLCTFPSENIREK
jgi:hypothetical protein